MAALTRTLHQQTATLFSALQRSSIVALLRQQFYCNTVDDISSVLSRHVAAVTLTRDARTVVCWHPEKQTPYEHTKPLPRRTNAELYYGDTPLKIQHIKESRRANSKRPDGPRMRELCQMFHVTHHVFRPNPGKVKSNPNPPQNRKAL